MHPSPLHFHTMECYQGMLCFLWDVILVHFIILGRLYLAALHYNENAWRNQAVTKKGEKRYTVLYPKYKKGGHIVRKLMENSSHGKHETILISYLTAAYYHCLFPGYVEALFTKLWIIVGDSKCIGHLKVRVKSPPPLSSSFEHPVKSKAIS